MLVRRELPSGHTATVLMTGVADGDASGTVSAGGGLDVGADWTWLHQVHGADAVEVTVPGGAAGTRADAAYTRAAGCTLAVRVADCAPVALMADGGGVAVAHAGWRGLQAGILGTTASGLAGLAGGTMRAVVGACIHPCCYEFGEEDMAGLVKQYGSGVRQTARSGRTALDLPAAVRAALAAAGVAEVEVEAACTACDDRYWSFRATGCHERQAMAAWLEEG